MQEKCWQGGAGQDPKTWHFHLAERCPFQGPQFKAGVMHGSRVITWSDGRNSEKSEGGFERGRLAISVRDLHRGIYSGAA